MNANTWDVLGRDAGWRAQLLLLRVCVTCVGCVWITGADKIELALDTREPWQSEISTLSAHEA